MLKGLQIKEVSLNLRVWVLSQCLGAANLIFLKYNFDAYQFYISGHINIYNYCSDQF